jgi:hypothetical protein
VLISARMPKQFEANADVKAFTQHFSLFGVNQSFNGSEASASLGDRVGKMQYDFTPTLQGGFTLGYWHQTYNSETSTFLRDADGNPVYSGNVSINGYHYTIPAAAFAPGLGHSENWLYGVSLKTRNATGWNGEAIASYYDIGNSVARTANAGSPGNGPGTVLFGDGTGWGMLELRGTYTPATNQAGLANHALSFGYHYDNYFVDNRLTTRRTGATATRPRSPTRSPARRRRKLFMPRTRGGFCRAGSSSTVCAMKTGKTLRASSAATLARRAVARARRAADAWLESRPRAARRRFPADGRNARRGVAARPAGFRP